MYQLCDTLGYHGTYGSWEVVYDCILLVDNKRRFFSVFLTLKTPRPYILNNCIEWIEKLSAYVFAAHFNRIC